MQTIEFNKLQPGLSWVGGLIFANFKIPFTRKNWLLKFGFAYSLAQILEPKLLVHEILKFVWDLPDDKPHAVRQHLCMPFERARGILLGLRLVTASGS